MPRWSSRHPPSLTTSESRWAVFKRWSWWHDADSLQDNKVTEGIVTTVSNPSDWVEKRFALAYLEPMVLGTIISPGAYLSGILELCHSKVTSSRAVAWYFLINWFYLQRGEQREITNIDQNRLNIQFLLPLNEIVTNFYDELKGISSGYASFDYEDAGYQQSELLKLGIYLYFTWKCFEFCFLIWQPLNVGFIQFYSINCRRVAEWEASSRAEHNLPREQAAGPRQGCGLQTQEWAAETTIRHRHPGQCRALRYFLPSSF